MPVTGKSMTATTQANPLAHKKSFLSPRVQRPKECWVAENYNLRTCVRDDRKCLQVMVQSMLHDVVAALLLAYAMHALVVMPQYFQR